nr:MAG TPA: hypothetical protein [Bacteriophage sp.]
MIVMFLNITDVQISMMDLKRRIYFQSLLMNTKEL